MTEVNIYLDMLAFFFLYVLSMSEYVIVHALQPGSFSRFPHRINESSCLRCAEFQISSNVC